MLSKNVTSFIFLYGATLLLTKSMISLSVALAPGFRTTKALGFSPAASSGTPMTAASNIAACSLSMFSNSAGGTWNPLTFKKEIF